MNRFRQVSHYAWQQSSDIAESEGKNSIFRLKIFFDMLNCYHKYRMWTNQYVKERFYLKTEEEREKIGDEYKKRGIVCDAWQKDFRDNRKFFIKYGNVKYEKASLREKRRKAYRKRYHIGEGLMIEYDVEISRQHYLEGTLSIGRRVLLAKHVFIDYSGDLIIHDDVHISAEAVIETHSHTGFTKTESGNAKKERLEIFDHVNLGIRSIITESCHKIGRYAKIGAGTVVRGNVPPYAIVMGNPGKIVGFILKPEEMVTFEESRYPVEERTSFENYSRQYNMFYRDNMKNVSSHIKLQA